MSQSINEKVKNKINEDLSPTKNITGLHLKIVAAIAIIWSLFQLWYASPSSNLWPSISSTSSAVISLRSPVIPKLPST